MFEGAEAEDVRVRMEQVRSDLGRNVEHTVENVRAMFDWRHHVATHPWLCLTAAAAAGFLLVPRRTIATTQWDHAAPSVLLPRASGIVAAVVGLAANVAIREGMSLATRYIENRMHKGSPCASGGCEANPRLPDQVSAERRS
jgi:hypothetical protein